MRLAPTRALGFGIALALATSLTACAAQPGPAAIAPATGAASAARPTGKVQIDLSGLLSQLQGPASRRTLAFGLDPARYSIAMIRVWAQAPGGSDRVKVIEAPWNTAAAGQTDKPALPSYTVLADVPVGKNQVFTVEALNGTNEDSQVLLRMSAAASVEVAGAAAIRLNFLEDAVARVIGELDAKNQNLDEGTPMTILETDDLVTPLRNFLTGLTGFTWPGNTYGSGRPAPQYVKTYVLSERLFADRNLDWVASNTNFTDPPMAQSPELAQLLQPFDLSSAEMKQLQVQAFFGEFPSNPNYDDYRISILAPTYSGWGAISFQTLDDAGYYTPTSLPLGTYIAVAHSDNAVGGWNDWYREIRVTEMGVEMASGMFMP